MTHVYQFWSLLVTTFGFGVLYLPSYDLSNSVVTMRTQQAFVQKTASHLFQVGLVPGLAYCQPCVEDTSDTL